MAAVAPIRVAEAVAVSEGGDLEGRWLPFAKAAATAASIAAAASLGVGARLLVGVQRAGGVRGTWWGGAAARAEMFARWLVGLWCSLLTWTVCM